jgi:hypothetical protein
VLHTQKLLAELERQRDRFSSYSDRFAGQLSAYRTELAALGSRFAAAAALDAALDAALRAAQASAEPRPALGTMKAVGARPTAEYDAWYNTTYRADRAARPAGEPALPMLPFGRDFAHHEAAREWAECLRGTTTLAVDGSQLLPWRDASVPVALVQAGIFENPHRPPEAHVKDVVTEILGPEELVGGDPDVADARTGEMLGYSERLVHLRRYELELTTLIARMQRLAASSAATVATVGAQAAAPARPEVRLPAVAFYDGSLLVSFALKLPPAYRERYARAAERLLEASCATGVPVIGYIDTSYARDLVTMLRAVSGEQLAEAPAMRDALIFHGRLGWGDRTPAFLAARGALAPATSSEPRGDVAFVYFQAALDRPPARLEFPRWVLDAGLLDHVMDVARAETIVGNGYPYPIEAADAVAVISTHDRAQFYALFQEWAAREGFPFTFSRKALSKSRRRV